MATEVLMPQMGESIAEGTLTRWFKQPGDVIKRDEPLFEISTDKVDAEVPAPADGVLEQIIVEEGATVEVNTVVALLGSGDGAAAAPVAEEAAAPAAAAPAATPEPAAAPEPAAVEATPAAPPAAASSESLTDVPMPQMGESIAEGTLTRWFKGAGDSVERDEPLFEISTDKVDAEVPAPASGVLAEILVEEGTTVEVNTIVARIGAAGSAAPAAAAPATTPEPTPAPTPAPVVEQPAAAIPAPTPAPTPAP
ncbi:MAG: hypothetical protein CBC13_07175, partial [Planctomycetia bacterium TMED53]